MYPLRFYYLSEDSVNSKSSELLDDEVGLSGYTAEELIQKQIPRGRNPISFNVYLDDTIGQQVFFGAEYLHLFEKQVMAALMSLPYCVHRNMGIREQAINRVGKIVTQIDSASTFRGTEKDKQGARQMLVGICNRFVDQISRGEFEIKEVAARDCLFRRVELNSSFRLIYEVYISDDKICDEIKAHIGSSTFMPLQEKLPVIKNSIMPDNEAIIKEKTDLSTDKIPITTPKHIKEPRQTLENKDLILKKKLCGPLMAYLADNGIFDRFSKSQVGDHKQILSDLLYVSKLSLSSDYKRSFITNPNLDKRQKDELRVTLSGVYITKFEAEGIINELIIDDQSVLMIFKYLHSIKCFDPYLSIPEIIQVIRKLRNFSSDDDLNEMWSSINLNTPDTKKQLKSFFKKFSELISVA